MEENKYTCDAYDSGYCYSLGRPLTDDEDDICEDDCCYKQSIDEITEEMRGAE